MNEFGLYDDDDDLSDDEIERDISIIRERHKWRDFSNFKKFQNFKILKFLTYLLEVVVDCKVDILRYSDT